METTQRKTLRISASVQAPVTRVWEYWSNPEHVTKWNSASPDWHTPSGRNDLRKGGTFTFRMEARDGSMGFDFGGVYDEVKPNEYIEYTMADNRKVKVFFKSSGDVTEIVEEFDAESEHSEEMQQAGWQAILDNFKRYTEEN